MKTGIIIDYNFDCQAEGGGYSYSSLFFNKLLSSDSAHQFIIVSFFSREELEKTFVIPKHVPVYALHKIKTNRLRVLIYTALLLKKIKLFSGLQLFLEEYKSDIYYQAFKQMGIECFVYLPNNKIYTYDIPFFYTVWDIGHRNINVFPEVSYKREFQKRETQLLNILPRAYKILAETEAGKRDLMFYYNIKHEKIIVAPLFAGDVVNHKNNPEESAHFLASQQLEEGYIFYPAQFWAHKNHINLLYAFQKLTAKYPQLKMVFCGSDKGNLAFVQLCIKKLQMEDKVTSLGFVKNIKQVRTLYENALMMVMPTFLGPSNMPVLEAMALGCPVICTDFEGHRELAGDNALYVRAEDPDSIVAAMELLLSDPARRLVMADQARIRYKDSLNNVDHTIRVLMTALNDFAMIRRCWH